MKTKIQYGSRELKVLKTYDTVIVGGGSAGSSAGYTSAKNGFSTLIIDKAIRLQKKNAWSRQSSAASWQEDVDWMIEELTEYNDGGASLPNLYIVLGKRIIDLSGLQNAEQIKSIGGVELSGIAADTKLIVIATKRVDG